MPDIFDGSQHSTETTTKPEAAHEKHRHAPSKHIDEYSDVMKGERSATNPLSAFAPKPRNVCFDSQLNNEHVVLLLRRHPVTQLPWILITVALLFFPAVAELAFPWGQFLTPGFQMAALFAWYALVFSFALQSFLIWFFNVNIITDERVIDVDFYSLIYKNISAAKIDNVEDITATTGGAIASIFDYGTVKIQTAAAVTEFEFEDIPHPAKVTAILNEMLLEEEREQAEGRVN